jgi:hypothetical protein
VKRRNFIHVLGVDLGGGKGKKTAVATLRVEAHNATGTSQSATVVEIAPRLGALPVYDDALVESIRSFGDGTLLCVDPAVIAMRAIAASDDSDKHGGRDLRRGKPAITPYTQRPTEVFAAHRLGIIPREALGQGTGPLAARAAHLTRALADRFRLNENLLEVYPKGTLQALGFSRPYKKHLHERETRASILEALSAELRFGPGVWRELCIQSDHLFDAVICAFTGFLWARDAWAAPSARGADDRSAPRVEDGWIWLPPLPAEPVAETKAAEG